MSEPSIDRIYEQRRAKLVRRQRQARWLMVLLWTAFVLLAIWVTGVNARGSYSNADPQIRAWYKAQHNAQGQWCCDESDGHPYFGAYTLNGDGSVTLHLKSGDRTLPKYMVLKGPNPTGHAVWWYIETGNLHTDFCFAPGTLT